MSALRLKLRPKSLCRSREGSHFYGTEYEIWANFGLVGSTEKKIGGDYEQLLRPVSSCFCVQMVQFFFKTL
jgi:hypothetical protein